MVVALAELDLELDPAEERRRRPEDDAVGARLAPSPSSRIRPSSSVSPEPTSSSPRQSSTRTPAAGRAALGVEDVGRDGHGATLRREPGGLRPVLARDLRLVGVHEPRRRETTSAPPTNSRSTRWGPEKTSPATGSAAPPSSRPSVRQTARSARFPGSSEPMSSRPIARAPPCVASCKASRARHRARARRARGRRGAPASPRRRGRCARSTPTRRRRARRRRRASTSSRTGAIAGAEAEVRGRAVRDADAVGAEALDLVLREVDAVGAPDVVAEPADAVEVLDRPAAVELARSRPPPRPSRPGGCGGRARAGGRARPTPPSGAS